MRTAGLFFIPFALGAAVFPPGVSEQDVPRLLESTKWVRSLAPGELVKLVPERSGLFFVGCPNCNGGRQEGQLAWSPERPGEVYCRYCNHRYPSEKFPMREAVTVRNPRGEMQRYPYWADAKGYRYFFEARRDALVRDYLAARARELAQLYAVTGDKSYAQRAALILDRFAQVFPGWCYHYDYPFQQKIIYDGAVPPEQFRAGYRTARWTWWAYLDVPVPLVEAYDWIRASGALDEPVRARIERDLFRNAAAQVLANPETNGNMSPGMWASLIRLGRIIDEPDYIEEPLRRFRRFLEVRFFYDGVWPEGAPSYHAQTVGGLSGVLRVLEKPAPAEILDRSRAALMKMRLPDGRFVPVHDTWSKDHREPLEETRPFLLPALGHACLGGGRGAEQTQFHLTWSGGYGHQHGDNLSLTVFAHGREMLSDIGYTHTRQRAWTLATAAHNTVVIDGRNQNMGSPAAPSDGSLRWFDAPLQGAQTVSADGSRGYPDVARLYRRTITVMDAGAGRRYAVDLFEVEGGATHDYLLHGDADVGGSVDAPLEFARVDSLLPAGFDWRPAMNEGDLKVLATPFWAYGYFRNLRAAKAPPEAPLAVTFGGGKGTGLRVTLLPEANSRLILGEDPAVRGADEDDANLDRVSRPFLMLRREAAGARSTFIAVLEPFGDRPFITAVERAGANALRITIDGNTTQVVPYGGGPRGTVERARLESVDGDALVIGGHALPRSGEIVRLLTTDGWVYPYTVAAAARSGDGVRVRVVEGPGIAFDRAAAKLRLTSYPQREHAGPVTVEWIAR